MGPEWGLWGLIPGASIAGFEPGPPHPKSLGTTLCHVKDFGDKHMTTGRINQVAFLFDADSARHPSDPRDGRVRGRARRSFVSSEKACVGWTRVKITLNRHSVLQPRARARPRGPRQQRI